LDEILAFVTLVALCLSPLPALPLIIDIYGRFPLFTALPIVYFGIVASAFANYAVCRYLAKTRHSVAMSNRIILKLSSRNISQKSTAILGRIKNMSTLQLYALVQMSIVPAKIMFASCGILDIPPKRFLAAIMMANAFSQIYYWILGASAGGLVNQLAPLGKSNESAIRILSALLLTIAAAIIQAVFSRLLRILKDKQKTTGIQS
jgi:uncharacterized membrane protein YdjX (TVP38/TMEM64 family)